MSWLFPDERKFFESRAGQVRDIGIRQATYQRFFFVALSLTASLAVSLASAFGSAAASGFFVATRVFLPRCGVACLSVSAATAATRAAPVRVGPV